MVQDSLLRLAEIGWQLTLMYTEWVINSAGTDRFNPVFELEDGVLETVQEHIRSETDPITKQFWEAHLAKILGKRRAAGVAYDKSSAKDSKFKKDVERGQSIVKHSVVCLLVFAVPLCSIF